MNLSIIACHSQNRVMGINGKMPWHQSADLKRFKEITLGHPVIMGRKTFQSLQKPLPERHNIILSRKGITTPPDCEVISSPDALGELIGNRECFVIGGAEIYRLFWNQTKYIYRTLLDANIDGDTYFPQINKNEWRIQADGKYAADENNDYNMRFEKLQRISHPV